MCIGVLYSGVPVYVSASAPQNDTLIEFGYITSAKTGNIFAVTDTLRFTQSVKNLTGEKVFSKYRWSITNEEGEIIERFSQTESFESREIKTRTVIIGNPGKYGIYTINVTEENYLASAPEYTYTDTYSEEFSVCISLGSANTDPAFGFNSTMINYSRPFCCDLDIAVPLMKSAGAKWHRESVMWGGVEAGAKGRYINLAAYKERIREIKDSGIDVVLVLTGCNPLYDNNKTPSSPEAIAAYASFCAYMATELSGLVDHFEIWNEWNHSNFNPSKEPPETYARLLKAAYSAIKEVDSDIVVIGCNTAGITNAALDWMGRVFAALDGGTYMDAVSVHCYDYSAEDGFPEEQFVGEASALKSLMREYDLDIPVWLSETGFSTYDNSTSGFVPGCTKDVQLNSLVMLRSVSKAYGLFDNIIQYCLYDMGDNSQVESCWGVLNCWKRDTTPKAEAKLLPNGAKPSYLGMAAMSYFVGGNTDYVDMLQEGRSYAFRYYNNNLQKDVILAINGGLNDIVTKSFQLGCSSVDIYDKYGNLTRQLSSHNGVYSIDTYSDPIYIVGNFTDFNLHYSEIKLRVAVDLNTLDVTVSGKTPVPNDLVSIMVVTKGEELTFYDPSRVQYMTQTESDSSGNFTVSYTADSASGTYQVYANSERERSRVIVEDLEFIYTVPKLSVTKNEVQVTSMSQLIAGDRPVIRLSGFETEEDQCTQLLVAQYEGDLLKSVKFMDVTGSFTTLGSEFVTDFAVSEGTEKIKIMLWDMNTMVPLAASYGIN